MSQTAVSLSTLRVGFGQGLARESDHVFVRTVGEGQGRGACARGHDDGEVDVLVEVDPNIELASW